MHHSDVEAGGISSSSKKKLMKLKLRITSVAFEITPYVVNACDPFDGMLHWFQAFSPYWNRLASFGLLVH